MTDLSALIERLEKASGELDIDTLGRVICAGYGVEFQEAQIGTGDDGSDYLDVYNGDGEGIWSGYRSRAPDVSIDAALAFVERVLPGWTVASIGQQDDKTWFCELREGYLTSYNRVAMTDTREGRRPAKPALAILIAALKALQDREAEHG